MIAIINQHPLFDWWTAATGLTIAGEVPVNIERRESEVLSFRLHKRRKKEESRIPHEKRLPHQMTSHKSTTMKSVVSTHFIKTNERWPTPRGASKTLIVSLNCWRIKSISIYLYIHIFARVCMCARVHAHMCARVCVSVSIFKRKNSGYFKVLMETAIKILNKPATLNCQQIMQKK